MKINKIHKYSQRNHVVGQKDLTPILYRKNDVAFIFNVTMRTVDNWINSGSLKAVKVGRAVRISDSEISRLLGDNCLPFESLNKLNRRDK